ncbi:MAG: hypothetical protein KDD56_07220, partial [Bdellovibrionales bacterium]|nr:hypothetical protein [Bdellovibrionales bacterium]
GGASIVWNLWVVKYAPSKKTADYMAVHTFLTGMRGVLSPVFAFWAIQFIGYSEFAYYAASLSFLAVIVLAPVVKTKNRN